MKKDPIWFIPIEAGRQNLACLWSITQFKSVKPYFLALWGQYHIATQSETYWLAVKGIYEENSSRNWFLKLKNWIAFSRRRVDVSQDRVAFELSSSG